MGKSINLNRQQELLARVTGGKNLPPAAVPTETIVSTQNDEITGNIAEIMAEEKMRMAQTPTPNAGKFVPPEPIAVADLTPEKMAEIRKSLSNLGGSTNITIENDTPEPAPASPIPEPAPLNVLGPDSNETGIDTPITVCPRCAWDLTLRNGPEPTYDDKLKFITAMLANKPFVKRYSLFNGELFVTFRSLRPKEIDTCYEQIVYDVNEGKIKFQGDLYEVVNRYRFYLQLVEIKTKNTNGFSFEFPEGFTPKTNKTATTFWELPDTLAPDDRGLGIVEEYMTTEIFQTESLHRVVASTCRDFNRMVAQLEAMVDNANFWKQTETPS